MLDHEENEVDHNSEEGRGVCKLFGIVDEHVGGARGLVGHGIQTLCVPVHDTIEADKDCSVISESSLTQA